MSPLHPARRSAERFDALVERGRSDAADPRTAELLELVGALRAVPPPEPRPEFVSDLRAQLMVAAESQLVSVSPTERDAVAARLTVQPRRRGRERRVSLALGAFAVVGATTSMAVASQGALPGDSLYPVKRAIESTQTGFSLSDDAKGRNLLANAADRLGEVGELAQRADPDAALVSSTLATFSDQSTQASDLLMSDYEQRGEDASIDRLRAFTAQSIQTLGELESLVPADARESLLDAAEVLFTIDSAAEQVCPGCTGEGITEIPGQLLAGAPLVDAPIEVPAAETPAAVPTPTVDEGKGNEVSGIDPPEVPVSIPPTITGPVDQTTQGVEQNLPNTGNQGNPNQGNQQGQGKPPKNPVDPNTTVPPLDQTVTGTVETVDEVVTGVLEGVNGLLGGLTGGLTNGPTGGLLGQQPAPPAP